MSAFMHSIDLLLADVGPLIHLFGIILVFGIMFKIVGKLFD